MKMTYSDILGIITDDIVDSLLDDREDGYLHDNFSPDKTIKSVEKMIAGEVRKEKRLIKNTGKKKTVLIRFLIAAILITAMSSVCIAVRKRDLVKDGGAEEVSEYNKDLIGKVQRGQALVAASDGSGTDFPVNRRSGSMDGDYQWDSRLIEAVPKDVFAPKTIIEFEVSGADGYDVTPEIIFTNDVMVIFTRENGEGWFLDKGESLTFEAEQYPLENGWNGDGGQWIEYRSIRDGELSPDSYADNKRIQKFTVTAEEEGEYYISLRCAGTEPITLKEGTIN